MNMETNSSALQNKGFFANQLDRRRTRMILIDDDLSYRKIMEAFAHSRGIELQSFATLEDLGSIARFSEFDIAIVDYELGDVNGIEIAEYLPVFFGNMPLILISGRQRQPSSERPWPTSITRFLHKEVGPDLILDEAQKQLRDRPVQARHSQRRA